MPGPQQIVGLLWRWHRRLGVFAAFFVLVLVVSGILLNHTSELGLDRSFVNSIGLSRLYGDDSATLRGYQLGGHWLFQTADGRVYLDVRDVAPCNGTLVGALKSNGLFLAACEEELLLITESGQLLESVSASTGLPVPLQGLGLVENTVVVRAGENWRLADLEMMDFDEYAAGGALIQQVAAGSLPETVRQQVPGAGQWLTWERVLLDLHSGRVLGRAGVWLVDIVGVLLASLAMSGLAMWWLHRRRRRRLASPPPEND
jgi:hypothetical protein